MKLRGSYQPPALPEIHGMGGKFEGQSGIFAELEAMLLRTIEPEDHSFADFGRLVLMSEFHPALQIGLRCHCLFDRFRCRL